MSKEMICCPFCGGEFDIISVKRKMLGCPKCLHIADGAFWAKVIQSQRDLQIAKQMLEETKKLITKFYNSHPTITVYQVLTGINGFATQALAQITHDNKDKK